MAEETRLPSTGWESSVSVREDLSVEGQLRERWARRSGQRAIGVTDLLALRRAYYRRVGPAVTIPPERQARLEQGRAIHRNLGDRLAREGILEARVRREGVVGRIDLLADVPVEVKTGSSFVDPDRLALERPDHLEQLAAYCALLDRPLGRLLTLRVEGERVVDAQALDIRFEGIASARDALRDRARLLANALTDRSVDRLPRCPWFGRGCEYGGATACACTGDEPIAPSLVDERSTDLRSREDIRERIRALFSEPSDPDAGRFVFRFRDLLYPRRAYFERVSPMAEEARVLPPYSPEPDLYAQLSEVLESGDPGEVCRLPTPADAPEDEVVGFRNEPLLLRTSRAWSRLRPTEILGRFPQYALELGLRCAVTGIPRARLVVGFERAEEPRDKLQVLKFEFASLTPFSRIYRDRRRALWDSVERRSPDGLPSCLAWMVEECPYRGVCGCDATPRVTR